ncbi:amidase family protein [Vagococcus salmoninarum]|uniref:amidase family protein n=1 Tax=Vagococcus salmoninarum TaxID=2739 RepID=UPI0028D80146|nr:amidase family protein [Vagococcus salmoninarum]
MREFKRKLVLPLSVLVIIFSNFSSLAINSVVAQEATFQRAIETRGISRERYNRATALELAEMVRSGHVTSGELVQLALDQISENDPQYNAVITTRRVAALAEAEELVDRGQPFLGVPLLLKGLGHTLRGESNTNGIGFLKDQVAGGTGRFTKALQEAGFIIIGQTNFPEMGLKNVSDARMYGPPTSTPWNPAFQAGGSSGGSAASVADGMVPVASGSDAGGSIRIPASWTSTIGLKPSRGILLGNSGSPRNQTGHFALTRSMADTEKLFQELEVPGVAIKPPTDLKSLKIGYTTKSPVGTPVSLEAEAAVTEAVAFLRSQGFTVEAAEPAVDGVKLMESYYTIAAGSMGIINFLANQTLKRDAVIDDVELLTWGLYQTSKVTTSDEVTAAWEFNQEVGAEMTRFHQEYPIFLTPTTAWTAPEIGNPLMSEAYQQQLTEIENLAGPERKQLIYDQWLEALTLTPYTQQANLTGQPALSLPTYVSPAGLPLGIQLTAAKDQDLTLLAFGELFEEEGQFRLLHPLDQGEPTEPSTSASDTTESTSESSASEPTTSSSAPSETTSESDTSEGMTSSSDLSETTSESSTSEGTTSSSDSSESTSESSASEPSTSSSAPSESTSESSTSEGMTSSSDSSESTSESSTSEPTLSQFTGASSSSQKNNQQIKPKLPKTGEKSPWGASLLGISLSGSIFVILRRKHKSQR